MNSWLYCSSVGDDILESIGARGKEGELGDGCRENEGEERETGHGLLQKKQRIFERESGEDLRGKD